ncbi:MAG: SLC13 family permease [Halococcoides sp.]
MPAGILALPWGLTPEMAVVFALIAITLVLFVVQPIPIDTTAIALMVALIALEPWTGVTPADGVSGFANSATVTVLAMFIISEGVRRTGAVQLLTQRIGAYTGTSELKQLIAIVGLAGPPAGFVNNTPIVAILIPAVKELSERAGTSPSKLLMPLSFAAMMGGTLTLIGTSTNLLASDVWARQGPGGEPFSMFEFTLLGVIVLVVGVLYLLTIGRYLTPARIPGGDPGEEFEMTDYLTDVVVRESSPLIGRTVREIRRDDAFEIDIFQIVRDGRTIAHDLSTRRIRAGDILAIRTGEETIRQVLDADALDLLAEVIDDLDEAPERIKAAVIGDVGEDMGSSDALPAGPADEPTPDEDALLTEIVLLPGSWLSGREVRISDIQRTHDVSVLAVRRGSEVIRQRMRTLRLQGGDSLLVQCAPETVADLQADRHMVVAGRQRWEIFEFEKIPIALAIVAGVVGLAALNVTSIMVSALAGIVAMIVTGCLRPADAYDAVSWDVIFLLAGVIPLGIAMERSGAAQYLGDLIVASSGLLGPIALLGVFYLFTALLTNLVSNNASVVLMIPVAIQAAVELGHEAFPFVLAVTFAASTAFLTPVGYQTNLMVYGPGGYRFSDFVRVGLPLQLLLTVVTPLGIALLWSI